MGSFDCNQAGEDLAQRYANVDDVDDAAVAAWRGFIHALEEGALPAWQRAYSAFVLAVTNRHHVPAAPRVFVSHRQMDGAVAEQIAWQAGQAGNDYWLDLHDANLQLVNQAIPPNDPRYALIIAAMIEMALLHCTHVIATHTRNSLGSKWIPYELARAKGRQVISGQAAGWFDPASFNQSARPPESQGEYVVLADILYMRADVDRWLGAPRPLGVAARRYLGTPNPPPIVFN
jgi:TIR domain